MQSIRNLVSQTSTGRAAAELQAKTLAAQALWAMIAPADVQAFSRAIDIRDDYVLYVIADHGAVANKIKLLNASLLTQLGKLQNSPEWQHARKITAIKVKVQVKSVSKVVARRYRQLSPQAVECLAGLVNTLEESSLKTSLNRLMSRSKSA